MYHRIKIAFAGLVLFAFSMACSAPIGAGEPQSVTSSKPLVFFVASPTPTPAPAPASCPIVTDEILTAAKEGGKSYGDLILNDDVYLVTYQVDGEEIKEPNYENFSDQFQPLRDDWGTHMRIWEYFRALIPADQRTMLAEYIISTDGTDGLLAAVGQTDSDPESWALQVDIADADDNYELTYILLHEFGHLLTLGPDQVSPSLAVFNDPYNEEVYFREAAACQNYFPGEGCARADSYIDDFYDRFWDELYAEWIKINFAETKDSYIEQLEAFYEKYEDRFVTKYSVTNPEEDIAESFSFFIFSPKPTGNAISDKKILFFYKYPELVELREVILNNVCSRFPGQ